MFGLSGTAGHGRSGTGSSDYREPESRATPQICWPCEALNYANKESDGFLLTAPPLCVDGEIPPPVPPQCDAQDEPQLTHVTLAWQEGKAEDWLRFGKPVAERIVDRHRRIESYAAGQVFAFVRWASNDYGTVRSTLDIVRAVDRGDAYTTLPQVDPGGDLLLSVRGWSKVQRVFELIDTIEMAGIDPCLVAPDHWLHMHNRLAAGMQPRTYLPHRHRTWLRRRKFRS